MLNHPVHVMQCLVCALHEGMAHVGALHLPKHKSSESFQSLHSPPRVRYSISSHGQLDSIMAALYLHAR